MKSRTAYIRRSRKGLRIKKRALIVTVLGLAACTGLLLQGRAPAPERGGNQAVLAAAAPSAPAGPASADDSAAPDRPRRIYPYSIVAGGVSGRAELARIIQSDKVVAAHYASFQVAKAHPVAVAKARAVHVSYRKGDQVYWTKNKVMLAEGETVLSDGKNEIRGRCGNRISDVAMLPVEAAAPGEQELDAAVDEGGNGAPLQVAAPFGRDGGGRYSHQLLSYPNGAGLLAVTGGDGWHAPAGPSGSGMPSAPYPGVATGGPIALTGSSAQVVPTAPAAPPVAVTTPVDTASGGGSTSETPHGTIPTGTGSTGGSTSETPRGGSLADTAPVVPGSNGGIPSAPPSDGGLPPAPVGLPAELADTVQPDPEPVVPVPTPPGAVLWPVELPAVPVTTVEPTAEAPEPATLWLSGAGVAALLLGRRRRRG